jgi:hypothetical protein
MDQADSVHSTPPLNTSANNPLGAPEKPRDSLYRKTPITPEEAFQAIGRLRKDARDEIERLLNFLDATDNHMELEPDGTEDEDGDPAEFDIPDEDDDPAEPSLGSLDHHVSQERWGAGSRRDLEQDPAESGIADLDGLLEQVGSQSWQNGGMI